MSSNLLPETLAPMYEAVNQLDIPCFILTVDEDRTIRFGPLNDAHESKTGMTTDAIAGRIPHDILPPRMADTVMANYRQCLDTEASHTYEEVLELPAGRIWWQTTLSPIRANGRVVGIVGVATDITAIRGKHDDLMADTTKLKSKSAAMETLAHAAMTQMRGPLNNIATLARIFQSGGDDAAIDQPELIDLMIGTAVSALEDIDNFEFRSETQPVTRSEMVEIDFGHLCRDISALVDPERERAITFPEMRILAEKTRFESAISAIVEHAAEHSKNWLGLAVTTDPKHSRSVALQLRCDNDAPSAHEADRTWLISAVKARGGSLTIEDHEASDGVGHVTLYRCTIPGSILTQSTKIDPARAVNRRMKDHAIV